MSPWESTIEAARTGATWAWERIYRDYTPRLRSYLLSQGAVDPDDLLGEIWLGVARSINKFAGDEVGFRSWLFMIAHNRIIDERRRHRRRREVPLTDPTPERDLVESAESQVLEWGEWGEVIRLLEELSDSQRDVLALRVLAQLSIEETALVVGKAPNAVKALQRRGLLALRKKLREAVTL